MRSTAAAISSHSLRACRAADGSTSTSSLASHLHFDHAGGFTTRDQDGAVAPGFPRARYVVRAAEWDDATHPHERNRASYLPDDFAAAQPTPACSICVDEDAEIMPGVRVAGPAATRCSHQVVFIESGGRTAVFAADMIPTTAHVDEPWIMGYDLYPWRRWRSSAPSSAKRSTASI